MLILAGEYFNGHETKYYEAGQYFCTCCNECNLQLSFNKWNYRLSVEFHNGSRYDFTFIMKLIGAYEKDDSLEVIPTTEDKELMIQFAGIQFKDSFKMISNSLKNIVVQILGKDLTNYKQTRIQLKKYCEKRGKKWDDNFITLLTQKEPMFYSLIKSFECLYNRDIPK